MTPQMQHPAIALRDSLGARGVSVSVNGTSALKISPRTVLAERDEQSIRQWASALAALSQGRDVWLVWDSDGHADAIAPIVATIEGWFSTQQRWLREDERFATRVGWVRMQWWAGDALRRDAFMPTVGGG